MAGAPCGSAFLSVAVFIFFVEFFQGRGGAFVTSITGDPYNVIGLSLPLVRQMTIDLGVAWHSLWAKGKA